MRHGITTAKLNRDPISRARLLKNLATYLFAHERIQTTVARAKELSRYAEKIITAGRKAESVDSKLRIFDKVTVNTMKDEIPEVATKILTTLKERYASRPGGYTRIWRAGLREGDKAPIAIVELVDNPNDMKKWMNAQDSAAKK